MVASDFLGCIDVERFDAPAYAVGSGVYAFDAAI